MVNSVTEVLNKAHMTSSSTFGEPRFSENYGHPLTPSINFSSAYSFDDVASLVNYHENKYTSQRYNRDSNEMALQIENYFELLHPGLHGLVFNSGMSALAATLDALVLPNSALFISFEAYRKSVEYVKYLEKTRGIEIIVYSYFEEVEKRIDKDKQNVILVESPSNPHMTLQDYDAFIALKEKGYDAKIIFDMTFAGLLNFNIDFNEVDAIVHSCTKYISGHNDFVAGITLVSEDIYKAIWTVRSMRGGILDPMSGYLLLRSLRTYDMRISKQLENTQQILEFLHANKQVLGIYYPGMYNNKYQEHLFKKYHSHGGAVVSLLADLPREEILHRLSKLQSIKMAPSFGSIDSLIEVPSVMSHFGKTDDELTKMGLESNLIRFGVGAEPVQYLIDDLTKLLS